MAILMLTQDTDEKISYVANKIFEIEFLLDKGPKRLESYGIALSMLKAMKRGCTRKEAVETYCMECCPPGKSPHEGCQNGPCPGCWLEFLDGINPKKE